MKNFQKRFINYEILDEEKLKKLYNILNARPYLELIYEKEKIFSIYICSYADISSIQVNYNMYNPNESKVTLEKINQNNFVIINFPLISFIL